MGATEWLQGPCNSHKTTQRGIQTGAEDRSFAAGLNASYAKPLSLHSLIYKMGVIIWWGYVFLRYAVIITFKTLHHPWSKRSTYGLVYSSNDP